MIQGHVENRGVTIHLPHDTIRIVILTSRYDTYRDTFNQTDRLTHTQSGHAISLFSCWILGFGLGFLKGYFWVFPFQVSGHIRGIATTVRHWPFANTFGFVSFSDSFVGRNLNKSKSTGDLKEAGGSTKFGSLSFWPLNMLIFSAHSLEFAAISCDKNFEGQGYGFGLNAFMTGAFGAVKITVNLIFFRCLTFFYFIRNLLIS